MHRSTILVQPPPSGGTISVVRQPSGTNVNVIELSGTAHPNIQVITSSAVAAGNTLVALIGFVSYTNSIAQVSDNKNAGNWTKAFEFDDTSNSNCIGVYYKTNCAAGVTTVTCTFSANCDWPVMAIYEVAGLAGTLDGTAGGGTVGTATPSSGNIVTTQAKDILFGMCFPASTVTACTPGWTSYLSAVDVAGFEYQIVSATGTYAATFTTASATNNSQCIVALH